HQFEIVLVDRDDFVLVGRGRTLARAEHQRDARPVNVAVAQADARFDLVERDCEICRNGRLANAAFAARDRDYVFNSWNPRGTNSRARTGWRGVDVNQDFRGTNALEGPQNLFGIGLYGRRNVWVVCGERELHFDLAIVDPDVFD